MDGDAVLVNRDALAGYVRRVASLHDDRDELNGDIREVYKEAKDAGIDTTILREIVREHRTDAEARNSRYALLDGYRRALGMLADTPLGDAALSTAEPEQPARRGRGRPRKQPNGDTVVGGDPIADAMHRAATHLGTATIHDFRPDDAA
jgi:uncharacterized protein (UPF0335 family)